MAATPLGGPPVQDMPPPGGYPAIRIARHLPNRGPPGWAVFLGTGLVVSYGFYKLGQGNIKRREAKVEKRHARMALVPLLQAEDDARFVLRREAQIQEETQIMGHVPGWSVGESVYKSGKWVPPTFTYS